MRRLTVLRHAQAAELHSGGSDFERSLTPRGRRQAADAAARLIASGHFPDLVVASTAQRTRETAELVMAGGLSAALRHDARVYLATCEALVGLLRETDDSVSHLLLVGHNPGVSDLCRRVGGPAQSAELTTGAFLSFAFDGTWKDLATRG